MSLRLMAVHAHPDDESSKGAATYAHYLRQGADVMIVSCTGGERGDILNDNLERDALARRDLPGLRRLEMAAAQEIVGFQHRWLGYVDSGMASEDGSVPPGSFADIPVEIEAEHLVRLIREFKPHVMITYDENGGYPHPDHIRTHVISTLAYKAAADPEAYPGTGEPWAVSKLYYEAIFNSSRVKSVYELMQQQQPGSPLLAQFAEMMEWMRERPYRATTQIEVGELFELRDRALKAHASQVSPDSSFFFWPIDLQQRAWPYEDYQLAASRVATATPEVDLFQGIEAD
ncbi:mycothiol conjugate amidase Mca [Lysinibacter sp. HNR]|uniref:mycothiol conjugate amidase Mca n=1 Tax=Lysinibacter sp. HNR TaxID=3031408 RepID=UPI0024351530|nr:mycothiol conjugate amidase Mca [Lysinibacter sp. HNR]WGD36849.1 mycothiol conjugate amidase Mca [Lysinibacter sp. HNR]